MPTKTVAEIIESAGARLSFEPRLSVDRIHANPWNPNRMDDRTRAAVRESIGTYGFIDPVTVRPHPDLDGDYQIIDGEHRWQAAPDLNIETIPAIVLHDLPDTAARKLTIIFNETRGRPDDVLLGSLLADLQAEEGPEALRNALRYDDTELAHLLSLADADWSNFNPDGDPGKTGGETGDDWATIDVRVPRDFLPNWQTVLDEIQAREEITLHDTPEVANGQALEVLTAAYLAAG